MNLVPKSVQNPKIIITLGPSTNSREILAKIKDREVDFVRVNLSHSPLKELRYFIGLAKEVGLSFILDTEGSQVRTGEFKEFPLAGEENQEITIYGSNKAEGTKVICLKPAWIIQHLNPGDLLHVDFNSAVLRVTDISKVKAGYIKAKFITSGTIGKNKAVIIDHIIPPTYNLPTLTTKDYRAIKIGLAEKVGHIALSFVRKPEDIDLVRKATKNKMAIISKIECVDALKNLEAIIEKTDWLLIDRGDLSKEVPIEKIPLAQDFIIQKAKSLRKPVLVATNLMENMIEKSHPTRAEVHDIVGTLRQGATGLVLAAETAIGRFPIEAINRLKKIIAHTMIPKIDTDYLINDTPLLSVPPHGDRLVNRVLVKKPDSAYLSKLKKFRVDENRQMDVEQIAVGTFSPLEGFMNKKDLKSVLDKMRLANRVIWTLPILLDGKKEETAKFKTGEDIALTDKTNQTFAILHLEEKYQFNKDELVKKLYGTDSLEHPGVRMVRAMGPVFLAGKIDLIRQREMDRTHEFNPRQIRKLFEERGWLRVVGFHTRNVIHRGHENIQMKALEQERADGLFVHPVIGKKKAGDFRAEYIIKSYEMMLNKYYPKNKVLFGTFSSYPRYAGPREAVFTAICRKNYGCSHFIVGRDHTGVGNFYLPDASQKIFDSLPDIGIKIVRISDPKVNGTDIRKLLISGKTPPNWMMRPAISSFILNDLKRGRPVFVEHEK